MKPCEQHSSRDRSSRQRSVMVAALALSFLAGLSLASAQTFTVIHNFTGGADGANPAAGLTADRSGHLYGTTEQGGNSNEYCLGTCGAVYKIAHVGLGWVTTPIYDFHGGGGSSFDGANPIARVVFGPNGTLYGTASLVFNLTPPANVCKGVLCPWTETTINFVHQCCYTVASELTFDAAGDIYGSSIIGGTYVHNCGGVGCGFVFELAPSSGGWTETDLYSFSGLSDGASPESGVIFDQAGNLYGTTSGSGDGSGNGTVFELAPSGSGWTEDTLYYFQGGSDGKYPYAGLVLDAAGNLYGATADGGSGGGGTVFEMTPSNGNWNFTPLYGLAGNGIWDDGPFRDLTMDAAGNLYGTTQRDGAFSLGSVFKLTPSNGGWTYTSLHDFTGGADGAYPYDGLVVDASGNIYGTAFAGGITGANCEAAINYQCGVVFEITP